MNNIKLKELMKPAVIVPYSLNIAGVAVTMELNKTHCVLVEHYDGSFGIVTEKDIIRDVVARCRDPIHVRAWEIMKHPIITADEDTDIIEAIEIMRKYNVRNLIITRGENILGVVRRGTIFNSIRFEEEGREFWVKKEILQEQTVM